MARFDGGEFRVSPQDRNAAGPEGSRRLLVVPDGNNRPSRTEHDPVRLGPPPVSDVPATLGWLAGRRLAVERAVPGQTEGV